MKKNLLFLMGIMLLSTLFFSCLEEEEEEDEYNMPNTTITKCDSGQNAIITTRLDEVTLAIPDWPSEIRTYTATELSGYSIEKISRFSSESNAAYYLAIMSNNGILLFDNSKAFICAEGQF